MLAPTHLLMLLASTSRTRRTGRALPSSVVTVPIPASPRLWFAGLGQPRLYGGRQAIDAGPFLAFELAGDQLDAEMPLDFENDLQDVDGVDFQLAAQQGRVVGEASHSVVGKTQTLGDDPLQLLLNALHSDELAAV